MWTNLRKNIREILHDLGANSSLVEKVIIAFLISVILFQFAQRASLLHQATKSFGVAVALDDDTGNAIEVAMRTRLWDQNSWFAYGPLFYRIVHVAKHAIYGISATEVENQKAHHFTMMLISLICVFLLSGLLARNLTGQPIAQLVTWAFLTEAILNQHTWAWMLYTCKVETLAALIAAIAVASSIKLFADFDSKPQLRKTAAAWAFAFLTKMSMLYYIPGMVLFLFDKFKKQKSTFPNALKKLKPFLASFFLVYLAVGFPQSFFFGGTINNLLNQSKNLQPIDFDFFKYWIWLSHEQIKWPIFILIASAILFPPNSVLKNSLKKLMAEKRLWRVLVFVGLPFLFLFSKKNVGPHEWYPLAYIGGALVAFAFLLQVRPIFGKFQQTWQYRFLVPLIVLFLGLPFLNKQSIAKQNIAHAQTQSCSAEASATLDELYELNDQGKTISMDPFMPRLRKSEIKIGSAFKLVWRPTLEKLKELNPDVLALRSSWYKNEYFDPAQSQKLALREGSELLKTSQEFYGYFLDKSEARLPDGTRFSKSYSDNCGFEIWLKN